METITQLAENLKGILRMMVDFPEEVHVTPVAEGDGYILTIGVSQRDIGKVVGKDGRTARSIRTLFSAISRTQKIPILIDICEGGTNGDTAQLERMGSLPTL